MNKHLLKLKFFYNLIFLFILLLNVKGEVINYDSDKYIEIKKPGIISTYIDNSSVRRTHVYQTSTHKKNNRFLINILSIDCKVDLTNVQTNVIKNITHYNYNALSIFLNEDSNFSIKPLIQSKKEQSQNRKYPLIISRIDVVADNSKNSSIPELL